MYTEDERGNVVLTMSREDYQRLILALGVSAGACVNGKSVLPLPESLKLINRINEGNPDFTPYEVLDAT